MYPSASPTDIYAPITSIQTLPEPLPEPNSCNNDHSELGDGLPTERSDSVDGHYPAVGLLVDGDYISVGSGEDDLQRREIEQASAETVVAETVAVAKSLSQLRKFIDSHFHGADWQGVETILAFLCAYRLHETDPLWLHVIGPSGSAKTSLGIQLLARGFADHHPIGDISENTLLSGYAKGREGGKFNSLLHRVGEEGLLYSKEFTEFLAKDERVVRAVAGQLRSVYDGALHKETGASAKSLFWSGRLSVITAFTPSVEWKWLQYNREGERFLILRWRATADKRALTRAVRNQEGRQGEFQAGLEERVLELINGNDKYGAIVEAASPSDDVMDKLRAYHLPQVVAWLRSIPVKYDGRQVSHVASEESPTRVMHQLIKAARGSAMLHRRKQFGAEDWRIATRLALDSIPETRMRLLRSIYPDPSYSTGVDKIRIMSGFFSNDAIQMHLDELQALKVIRRTRHSSDNDLDGGYAYTEEFARTVIDGCPVLWEQLRGEWGEREQLAIREMEQ